MDSTDRRRSASYRGYVASAQRRTLARVVLVGALLTVAGAAEVSASDAIRPAPGTPDPKAMVLTSSDLGRAKVTKQRYFKDRDFPSVISYEREFEDGRFRATPLPYVDSQAEVGTSVLATTRFLAVQRRLFGTQEFRSFLAESLAEEFPLDGIVTSLQIGRPRSLSAGRGAFTCSSRCAS